MKPNPYKYVNVAIEHKPEWSYLEYPTSVLLIFSKEDIDKIERHREYAKNNDVTVRMHIMSEEVYYEEGVNIGEDEDNMMIPSWGYLCIHHIGFYYKAGDDGDDVVESELVYIDTLKDVVEWPEDILVN